MDERAFETLAERTLSRYFDRIETALGDEVEVELRGGVLTIELADGRQYVINKHVPNQQIWLSSPVSGASHYAWDETAKAWLSTRGPERLGQVLAGELTTATGTDVAFD